MEGGRYFRTGAYEKEKYYRKFITFYDLQYTVKM